MWRCCIRWRFRRRRSPTVRARSDTCLICSEAMVMMMRRCVVAVALSLVAAFSPSSGYAMERAAMDRLLAMAKARPDAPEFRQALIARLGDAPIKAGEAFDSNGPDFVWAVE